MQDSGIGIKEEEIGRLFKIFGKIENNLMNPSGIGLGLTICNKILNQLGSELECASKWGVGTVFTFELDLPIA